MRGDAAFLDIDQLAILHVGTWRVFMVRSCSFLRCLRAFFEAGLPVVCQGTFTPLVLVRSTLY